MKNSNLKKIIGIAAFFLIGLSQFAKAQYNYYTPVKLIVDPSVPFLNLVVTDAIISGQVNQRTVTAQSDQLQVNMSGILIGGNGGSVGNGVFTDILGYGFYGVVPSLLFPLNVSTAAAFGTTPAVNGSAFTSTGSSPTVTSSYLNIRNTKSASITIYITQTLNGHTYSSDQYVISGNSTKICYLRNINTTYTSDVLSHSGETVPTGTSPSQPIITLNVGYQMPLN